MSNLQELTEQSITRLRAAGTDLNDIEAKSAEGGFPRSAMESISAFSNDAGGTLILGLDESNGFATVSINAGQIADTLASQCSEVMTPPIRADIDIVQIDGNQVVVAVIDELPANQKPCFVTSKGIEGGSFTRTHDGDRRLTTYEVHALRSSQGQPKEDVEPVEGASFEDLDPERVKALLDRLRRTRSHTFGALSDSEILDNLRVTTNSPNGRVPTLGGLLALGKFPQKYFPQLNVTLVVLPTVTGEGLKDGTRFLDSQTIDGSIPEMVAEALSVVTKNLTRRSVIAGVGREDRYEYPIEAIREVIANALIHRDYHPLARGTQVRIELYPDRLEVISPGGLYGTVPRESLMSETVTSSRNSFLVKLLEDVEMLGTSRTICENRGSGLLATAAFLREAGLEPPVILERIREFVVVIRNHGLIDAEAARWLKGIDTQLLNDRQRLALVFLRRNATIINQQYRTLTGSDSHVATSELSGLAASGFIQRSGGRKWASWSLADDIGNQSSQLQLAFTSPLTAKVKKDRREAIRQLLDSGPRSTSDLATQLGLTGEGVLYWVRRMRTDGELAPTTTGERRNNEWRLIRPRK